MLLYRRFLIIPGNKTGCVIQNNFVETITRVPMSLVATHTKGWLSTSISFYTLPGDFSWLLKTPFVKHYDNKLVVRLITNKVAKSRTVESKCGNYGKRQMS